MSDADDVPFTRARPGPAGVLEAISPRVRRIVAPNPGPMTFTGTCTYVIGSGKVAVLDPGPDSAGHVAAILEALKGETIGWIVATHTHRDHTPATGALQAATGAVLVGCAPYAPPDGLPPAASHDTDWDPEILLQDGDVFEGSDFTLATVATPGHAANHLAFELVEERGLFSGDHVMGWSTSVVAPPDGNMSDYMASLEKLRQRRDEIYWPGHGAPVTEPQRYVRGLVQHRRQREASILARLGAGDRTVDALVERMYQGLDPRLRGGAARSVLAHLEDLTTRGLVRFEGGAPLEGIYRLA
jgi:glyoxylase-like metal-dependent hydrolase (beta-lactamase superfamily II)